MFGLLQAATVETIPYSRMVAGL